MWTNSCGRVQQKSNNVSSIEDEILRVDIIIDDKYTVP